ncbi:tyrosine-type recombinase/integrase [Oricola cellulosilytica]|uniref:Integrase n=1 Tax=Oricola cellulosilytica TaxID=1429082 RepID=A0A4R0PF30_9HYPH|nr:tyrosine-type recombinase/integrase [Oricola cellulosilytica]TCD15258.1 integrase [Oricola cellulosilytica]
MAAKIRNLLNRDGRYFARRVVPEELRVYFDGKRELRKPLGPDRRVAISKLPSVLATWNFRIEEARRRHRGDDALRAGGAKPGSPLNGREMAIAHYFTELELDMQERHFPDREMIADMSWSRKAYRQALIETAAGLADNEKMDATIGWALDAFRERGNHDLTLGSSDWRTLAMSLAAAQIEAMDRSRERDQGNFAGTPAHSILSDAIEIQDLAEPVSILQLLDDYLKELEASGKGRAARKRWTPAIRSLVKHASHDDANRLTKGEIVKWKEACLEAGLAPRTIKTVHLAALKAVLNWAKRNDRIAENPAAEVVIRADRSPPSRERGFREDEANAILRASKSYRRTGRETQKLANAKRWVPLICAHTGARVGEILQLRRQDIFEQDGIHAIRITPEAGTVKAGGYRNVPLHNQIVDEGFIQFVLDAAEGPLFLNTIAGATPRTAVDTAQIRLRQWLHRNDLVPSNMQPNHAWRHRFKTLGREVGIDSRILDAIQGHAPRTASEHYGDVTLRAMKNALDKIPRYNL